MEERNDLMKVGEKLEDYLQRVQNERWKVFHNGRTCWEAYKQLRKNLEPVQRLVETGAMGNAAVQSFKEAKNQALKIIAEELSDIKADTKINTKTRIKALFNRDPVIFLNDHGPEHVAKVIERADDILRHFTGEPLSELEAFVMLCAIQIHDIGNIMGRAGHEMNLHQIFEKQCTNIILERAEMQAIESIAMVHGGRTERGKDTISQLEPSDLLFGERIRFRLLAAVVRLADELADDSTRAHRAALDLGIIGTNSRIYHEYSETLHTVGIMRDEKSDRFKIKLIYNLHKEHVMEPFKVGGEDKFLLDEIYDRTVKMERERRYCMNFMQQYVNIGSVDVSINIYCGNCLKPVRIHYVLENVAYPTDVDGGHILDLRGNKVPNGQEICEQFAETNG